MRIILYTYLALLAIIAQGCDISETPVLENPADPLSQYFQGKASSDLSVEAADSNKIILKWKNNSSYFNKNIIQRSTDGSPFKDIAESGGSDSSYIDTDISRIHKYSYRVAGLASSGKLSLSPIINTKYEQYQDNFYRKFSSLYSFCISSDGRYAAFRKSNNEITTYDLENDKTLAVISITSQAMAFTSDGKRLAVGNNSTDAIEVRDIFTGQVIREFDNSNGDILSIAVSQGDSIAASIDASNHLRIHDLNTGKEKRSVLQQARLDYRCKIIINPDGKKLALLTYSGHISIIETGTLKAEHSLGAVTPSRFYFTSDNKYLAYQIYESYTGVWIHLVDVNTGLDIRTDLPGYGEFVFSPDEKILGSFRSNTADIWSLENYKKVSILKTIKCINDIYDLAFTRTGRVLIQDMKGELMLYDNKSKGSWVKY